MLYQGCDFGVDCDSRVAIVGPNGAGEPPLPRTHRVGLQPGYTSGRSLHHNTAAGVAGKSTFLKLLTGEIEPTEGHVGRHAKLVTAKFTQVRRWRQKPPTSRIAHHLATH